jgi:hypothetical protein
MDDALERQEMQVRSGDTPTDKRIAVAIAEAYLNVLSGGSVEQLRECLGRPAEQLLMGSDGRPYLITVTGSRCPTGAIHLYVSVSDPGWDRDLAVIRSAQLTFDADDIGRK